MKLAVARSRELLRVLDLPRRTWEQHAEQLVEQVSAFLTLPGHRCPTKRGKPCAELNGVSVVRARPWQASCLAELHDYGGCYAQAGVGDGKTWVSMVAGPMLDADRILIVVPAELRDDTYRKFAVLQQHWQHKPSQVVSYEFLSNLKNADFLDRFFSGARRALLVLDEAHNAKNTGEYSAAAAACARRINDFIGAWREEERRVGFQSLSVLDMSGTPVNRSILDCAPLMRWAQPDRCPLPIVKSDLLQWSAALDEKVPPEARLELGALTVFGGSDMKAARQGLAERIFSTPGFISAPATPVSASLYVRLVELPLSKVEDDAFEGLRRVDECETPDGWPIVDEVERWRHGRALGNCGMFYRWDPRPPDLWMTRRRTYDAALRELIANNGRKLYTRAQVEAEIREAIYGRKCPVCKRRTTLETCDGSEVLPLCDEWGEEVEQRLQPTHAATATYPAHEPHALQQCYLEWKEVEKNFVPNTVPVWTGTSALDYCATWAKEGPGIIWVEHKAFGAELARRTGLSYYAEMGLDQNGRPIEQSPAGEACIASIESNHIGRNLQHHSRNLVASCPPTGKKLEQLIGRTHRPGQRADVVRVDVLLGCREQLSSFEQAKRDCAWAGDVQQSTPKLQLADVTGLERFKRRGLAWAEQPKGKEKKRQVREALEALRPRD